MEVFLSHFVFGQCVEENKMFVAFSHSSDMTIFIKKERFRYEFWLLDFLQMKRRMNRVKKKWKMERIFVMNFSLQNEIKNDYN